MSNAPSVTNIEELLAGHPPRTNFNVIKLDNAYNVRVARVTGRFPWHRHLNGDEGWLIWRGRLQIDMEDGESIVLGPGECATIPKGVRHSPVCLDDDTTVVVFNVQDFQHEFVDKEPDLGDFVEHDV